MSTVQSSAFSLQVISPSSTPSYVPTTPFASRALSGSYAPINGKTKWTDAQTPEWATAIIYGLSNHVSRITIYSGGCGDSDGPFLFAHGGGHGDGAYNGIMQFDLNGTTAPTGWTELPGSASPPSQVPTTGAPHREYFDGKAGSIHSYDNLIWDGPSGNFYRFAGSYFSSGTSPQQGDWKFNKASGLWTLLPDRGFSWANSVDVAAVHDPDTRKVMLMRANVGAFYRMATETWGALFAAPSTSYHMHGCWDPTRNRAFYLGKGFNYWATVDFNAETVAGNTWYQFTASGDSGILALEGFATWYDAFLDRIWMFGARADLTNKLYWIDAADFDDNAVTVYSQSIVGDGAVPRQAVPDWFLGFFKRFVWIPQWRAVACVTTHDQPVYIIKLPSA